MQAIRSGFPSVAPKLFLPAIMVILLAVVGASPARADWTKSPMTFSKVGVGPDELIPAVIAAGVITADTPGQFRQFLSGAFPPFLKGEKVYLLSPGGDLEAGLQLGREIRAAGLATEVGLPGPEIANLPDPGMPDPLKLRGPDRKSFCASACTFVFLGGVARSAAPGSTYAVHRFFMTDTDPGTLTLNDPSVTTRQDQIIAGDIVEYIDAMGVSSELYKLMTEGSRSRTVDLTPEQMATLRVTTHETISADMLYPADGMPILVLRDEDGGMQYGRMDFFCTSDHQLLDRAYFDGVSFAPPTPEITLTIMPPNGGSLSVAVPPGSFSVDPLNGARLPIDVYIPPGPIYQAVRNAAGIEIGAAGAGISIGQVANSDQVGSTSVPLPADVHARLAALVRGC